jgi:addiction module HigA family antidote
MMATARDTYQPDYAVRPGWILEERLAAHGISHAELARRCGRSPKLISEIIAGKAPVGPETALQLEKALGMDASIWLGIEADYRLYKAREAEAREASQAVAWYKRFPGKELVKRGCIEKPANDVDGVSKILTFFGVATVDAWQGKFGAANVAYRHSPSFVSSEEALATWLRLGEIAAERQECAVCNEARFRSALKEIRGLTREPGQVFFPEMRRLCNGAGVALVVVKSLPGTALSGAARWLTPRRALIQLSLRHMSDDHLWFSFFHEAAHLLLHSKKSIFVEGNGGDASDLEDEANAWASNVLVPHARWEAFKATMPRSKAEILAIAREQGIAPGIVVGMLQHDGVLPWTHLNGLKRRYQWIEV